MTRFGQFLELKVSLKTIHLSPITNTKFTKTARFCI
ncbi:hypothetical protein TcasGA2_TC033860 [Tribolium castaneum]|uniref:Uncharacterized protein n=1 Tax=Tribolium castaneum TaxID=7070 RepID=A0A139WEY9_TRICA|nr:hypothetical protein TcasGA2_TC033860 [Tribolium castaneum]